MNTFLFNFRRRKDHWMVVTRDKNIMCRSCVDKLGGCYSLIHGISLYATQSNMQHLVVKVCISSPVVYFGLISNCYPKGSTSHGTQYQFMNIWTWLFSLYSKQFVFGVLSSIFTVLSVLLCVMAVPSRGTQPQTRRGPYPTRYVLSLRSGLFSSHRFNLP